MVKFAIKTLGCKVNQYESEKIQSKLNKYGFSYSDTWEDLDFIIINTCAVTHIAERKSRHFIRKASRTNPRAKIYVTGCASSTDTERLSEIVGVDFIVTDKDHLVKEIKINHQDEVQDILSPHSNQLKSSHTRAYLMIEDGCENFCSYCIIPYTRGKVKSIPFEELKEEIDSLIKNNIKEIVLTGINLGMYEYGKYNLIDICKYIFNESPETRVRLSSIEPNLITEDLINFIANQNRFCKHLHIPLQGATNKLLSDMNRKYTTEEYETLLNKIRNIMPDISITTDYIIGYPTETDEQFEESLEFIRKCNFSKMHIFVYSKRKGTPAAEIPHRINQDTIKDRQKRITSTENRMRNEYTKRFINSTTEILIEEKKNNSFWGYTSNYLRVQIQNGDLTLNKFYSFKLHKIENEILIGKEI